MQHIIISMDQIDSTSDMESFVQQHSALMQKPEVPPFRQHPVSTAVRTRHMPYHVMMC